MNTKIDFTKTGDVKLVLDTLNALDSAPPLTATQRALARDVLNSLALNSPNHSVSLLDAVRLGIMLAGRDF